VQPRAAATALNQQLSTLNAWKTADYRPGVESRRLTTPCTGRLRRSDIRCSILTSLEATSAYWKPPFYLLEDDIECWVVNARDVKNVPGRPKTDLLTELPDVSAAQQA
jgi:hypothetical protein